MLQHCDEVQWVDLPSKHAAQYKSLIEFRGTTTDSDHLCLNLRRGPALLRWMPSFPSVLSPYKTYTPLSSHQGNRGSQLQQPSPTYQPPGANASGSSNRTQGGGLSNSHPRTNTQNSCHSGLQITHLLQAYVLFGARREWPDLEMDHLNARATKDDCTFFYELKARYCSLRGWSRRWLSIWQLSHCDFVKVRHACSCAEK